MDQLEGSRKVNEKAPERHHPRVTCPQGATYRRRYSLEHRGGKSAAETRIPLIESIRSRKVPPVRQKVACPRRRVSIERQRPRPRSHRQVSRNRIRKGHPVSANSPRRESKLRSRARKSNKRPRTLQSRTAAKTPRQGPTRNK